MIKEKLASVEAGIAKVNKEISVKMNFEGLQKASSELKNVDSELKNVQKSSEAVANAMPMVGVAATTVWIIVNTMGEAAEYKIICRNLILNIPPRHGKSFSLTGWEQWIFGKNRDTQIVTISYNDILSGRFSGYVRDGIDETKADETKIIYSDIFPDTKIKHGDSAKQIWALEGSFFNYLGTGFGGTITGLGAKIGVIDDPAKNAYEANNEDVLDKQWEWYTDTFLSRLEENSIQVINMTRWSTKDLCGRILASDEAQEWYELKIKAYLDEENGIMLCPSILSFDSYSRKKRRLSVSVKPKRTFIDGYL